MVRTKMFDNIMKVIRVEHAEAADTKSVEIDLELPRGYIAKIKKVIFNWTGIGALSACEGALVNDPDDQITVQIPDNEVQHDVIADFDFIVNVIVGTEHFVEHRIEILFDQELDVVTARNLRFNRTQTVGVGGGITQCEVYYTLEQISDSLILELLDIL